MSHRLKSTWKENRGDILVSVAVTMIAIASALWYFEVLPEIDFTPMETYGENVPPPIHQPTMLVITIGSQDSLPEKTMTGFVQIFSPFGDVGDGTEPVSTQTFQLHEGGLTSVVFDNLSPGDYTPVIFLDSNANGKLDFDPSFKSTEEFRTARYTNEPPENIQREDNAIELEPRSQRYMY
ncbi:MAG: hypothetical protein AAGG44_12885, partial [Planctomycetota bacterium]